MQLVIPITSFVAIRETVDSMLNHTVPKRARLAARSQVIRGLKALKVIPLTMQVKELGLCIGADSVVSILINGEV